MKTKFRLISIKYGVVRPLFNNRMQNEVDHSLSLSFQQQKTSTLSSSIRAYLARKTLLNFQRIQLNHQLSNSANFLTNQDVCQNIVRVPLPGISKSMSLLERQGECLTSGLQLLNKLLSVSTDEGLKQYVHDQIAALTKEVDSLSRGQWNTTLSMSLETAYADLQNILKYIIIKPGTDEICTIFPDLFPTMSNLKEVNDILLENIRNLADSSSDQMTPLMNELKYLGNNLTYLKALLVYGEGINQENQNPSSHLLNMIGEATCVIYLTMVGAVSDEMMLATRDKLSKLLKKVDIKRIYLEALGNSACKLAGCPLESQFFLLDNMIKLLECNSTVSSYATAKLYWELKHLKKFLTLLPKDVPMRRLQHLESCIESVCSCSIPVLYSDYVENMEESMANEVDGTLVKVIDQIKHMKLENDRIMLNYYPKTDGLGFLKKFLEYLKDLLTCQPDATKYLMDHTESLHSDYDFLVLVFKTNKDKPRMDLWMRNLHLAYEAEHLIDSCLSHASGSSSVFLSLDEIVKQVSLMKEEVIMEYLVGGHEELDVIWMPLLEMTNIAKRLYIDQLVVCNFNVRAWCTISQNYQRRELLLKILDAVSGDTLNNSDLNEAELLEKLCIHLKHCRYLFVLDDVQDLKIWKDLKHYLPDNENGSRVLITTSAQPAEIISFRKLHASHGKKVLTQDVPKPSSQVPYISRSDTIIVGFEDDARTVREYIFNGERQRIIISIVGMPGIGKTTLTSSIYNDFSDKNFDVRAWYTVSQIYEREALLLSILYQVGQPSSDTKKLGPEDLAELLCRTLKKRRYLIVLDDVWDINVWNDLKRYLPDDGTSSRILITTRDQTVASVCGNEVHALQELQENESWDLFQKKLHQSERFLGELVPIGKEIVKSCKGLPLSIVIVAGLLSKLERSEEIWSAIAKNVNSHVLANDGGNCMAILDISYNHLAEKLKSCFLYLGAFPEGEDILVSKLKLLWVGEGFVRRSKRKSLDEAAEECLMDLIARSLVIPNKRRSVGGVKTCRVHDLLHDFCLKKAADDHFLMALSTTNCFLQMDDPRRVSIINYHLDDFFYLSRHSVRSLLIFHRGRAKEIDERISSTDLMLLRVFDGVMDSMIHNIPFLVHLRYLAIQGSLSRDSIPSTIHMLQNLQILIIVSDHVSPEEALEVPNCIWEMVKLSLVHIRPRASFQHNKSGNSLDNLNVLSNLSLSRGDEEMFKKLPNLQELSCILFYSWVDSLKCHQFPLLDCLSKLTKLKVENEGCNKGFDERKRCELYFPSNLKKLTLSGFKLLSEDISKIGNLPRLEVLKLYNSGEEFGIWEVNDDEFQNLKQLKLRDLLFMFWTASEDSFPSIEQLMLDNCDFLKSIPLIFGNIPSLCMIDVRNCRPSVDDSARKIAELQEEMQNQELQVHIYIRNQTSDDSTTANEVAEDVQPDNSLRRMMVFRVDWINDKGKQKAMRIVSGISGICSILANEEEKVLTVIGEVDPVVVLKKLRKFWKVEIISIGPFKELKKKEQNKKESNKEDVNTDITSYHDTHTMETSFSACIIC